MRQLPIWIVVAGFVVAAAGCNGGGEPGATATATVVPTVTASATAVVTATSTVVSTSTVTPSVSVTAQPTVGATGTAPVSPTVAPEAAAVEPAREALARWLGPVGDAGSIELVSADGVVWPNGCLGLSRAGVMCTEALVPGYRVMLRLGVATYEVRTDETGRQVRWAPQVQLLVRFVDAGLPVLLVRLAPPSGAIEPYPPASPARRFLLQCAPTTYP